MEGGGDARPQPHGGRWPVAVARDREANEKASESCVINVPAKRSSHCLSMFPPKAAHVPAKR